MKTVRVRIYICVLDDGDYYAVGWPNDEVGVRRCTRDSPLNEKESENNRAHYFWVEVDIKIRQDGNIVVTPEQSTNEKEKYEPSRIAAALKWCEANKLARSK